MISKMLKFAFSCALFFVLLACFVPRVSEARNVPSLSNAVTDEAQLLTASDHQYLELALRKLYESGGSQIAVLTVESLDGEAIESFSIKVVDQWKLGTSKVDNGVLLLVSKNDRKLRIEVGRGLEGTLTDLQSKRIIDQVIAPQFRVKEFSRGIVEGVRVIAKFTDPSKELMPGGPRHRTQKQLPGIFGIVFLLIILVPAILSRIAGGNSFYRRRYGGYGSSYYSNRNSGFGGDSLGGGGFGGGGGGFSGGGASGDW